VVVEMEVETVVEASSLGRWCAGDMACVAAEKLMWSPLSGGGLL
jgi:hypothetical protein